jgi:membrane protease YdiL (CAAX protease family)
MTYVLIHNNDNDGMTTPPTRLQKILFWSLAPAVLLVPIWIVFGKMLFGGPGGWGAMILMYTAAPVLFLYHVLLFLVALRKNRQKYFGCRDYNLSPAASKYLLAYYVGQVGVQLFMDDGGDQGSMGSVMEHWLGLSRQVCEGVDTVFAFGTVGLAVVLMWLLCCCTMTPTRRQSWDEEEQRQLFEEFV